MLCLAFVLLISMAALTACSTAGGDQGIDSTSDKKIGSTADWPNYDFKTLVTVKADLVAQVTVTDVEEFIDEQKFESQLATVQVQKTFLGQAPSSIVLHQALEYVEKGKTYIMFLKQDGPNGYYYELTGASIIPDQNGIYVSSIPGFEGEFTIDEFTNNFTTKLNSLD
jgi:hypothetical protein